MDINSFEGYLEALRLSSSEYLNDPKTQEAQLALGKLNRESPETYRKYYQMARKQFDAQHISAAE